VSLDYQSILKDAEHAVQGVKDPALKAVAFGKVIDALIGTSADHAVKRGRTAAPRRAPNGTKKKSGTSGVLQELADEDFFRSQRSLTELKNELANRGHHVPLTSLSGPMQALCKKRVLRREKKTVGNKQTYVYSNW
jgi:hypothetical protein